MLRNNDSIYRQTVSFGGESSAGRAYRLQLAELVDSHYFIFAADNFSIFDIFDKNTYVATFAVDSKGLYELLPMRSGYTWIMVFGSAERLA